MAPSAVSPYHGSREVIRGKIYVVALVFGVVMAWFIGALYWWFEIIEWMRNQWSTVRTDGALRIISPFLALAIASFWPIIVLWQISRTHCFEDGLTCCGCSCTWFSTHDSQIYGMRSRLWDRQRPSAAGGVVDTDWEDDTERSQLSNELDDAPDDQLSDAVEMEPLYQANGVHSPARWRNYFAM